MPEEKRKLAFDYSKFENIELSDDEDDVHPNIDAQSWFQLKHRMRVDREAEEAKEKADIDSANKLDRQRLAMLDHLINEGRSKGVDHDMLAKLEGEQMNLRAEIRKREERLDEMERNKKWNWENMVTVTGERTIIQGGSSDDAKQPAVPTVASPEQADQHTTEYFDFVEKHKELLAEFAQCSDLDKSRDMLHRQGDILMHEHSSTYLLLLCLEEEMAGRRASMERVSHQSQILSHLQDLGKSVSRPARDMVIPFFKRLERKELLDNFRDEVNKFAKRVQARAVEKKREQAEAAAKKEKEPQYEEVDPSEVPLGPGGLHPLEVLESLPAKMREAFESQDVEELKKIAVEMDEAEFKYHFQRCIDSGLWVDNSAPEEEAPAGQAPPAAAPAPADEPIQPELD